MQRSESISATTTIELSDDDIIKLLNNIDGGIPDKCELWVECAGPISESNPVYLRYHETHNT